MFSKFSMLMPVAFWLLHGGGSMLMSESWEMSPCKKIELSLCSMICPWCEILLWNDIKVHNL